jgi:exopolysaccharide biosynthesis polyprenyl glycosylphosphotransferase
MRRPLSSALNWLAFGLALIDLLCLQIALIAGYWLWIAYPWHGHYQPFETYAVLVWIVPPIGVLVFKSVGLYKSKMGVMGVEEQSLIFKAIWILYFCTFATTFFYREFSFSRLATFYSFFIAIILISTMRYFIRRFVQWLHKKGIAVQNALICGAGYHGQRLERWIHQSPKLGIRVIGYLDDDLDVLVKKPVDPPCLGKISDLKTFAKKKDVSLVFIAHRRLIEAKVIEVLQMCRKMNIRCWVIPALFQIHIESIALSNIGGIPLVGLRERSMRSYYRGIKRVLDILLAFILMIVLLPLGGLIAIAIKLISRGPVFFYQKRIGQNEKMFTIIKFRTMQPHQHKADISPELVNDSRGTPLIPFQRFLRRSGLDEIPQMINVLKGDMSIIGPRPEMPFIVKGYGPLERERLTVKPGITGLWQISEDRKRLLIHENMDYDLYYIEHLSFNLDLAILMQTGFVVLKRIFS